MRQEKKQSRLGTPENKGDNMNSCNFVGGLGRDWDVTYSQAGKAVAKNSMAIKKYNNETTWINIIAFGKTAETLAQYTEKGSQLAIKSEVNVNQHEGKYYTNFIINGFTFIGSKKQPQQQSQGFQNQNQQQGFQQQRAQDEIPF
jgi:single-strand DNA-binding protein